MKIDLWEHTRENAVETLGLRLRIIMTVNRLRINPSCRTSFVLAAKPRWSDNVSDLIQMIVKLILSSLFWVIFRSCFTQALSTSTVQLWHFVTILWVCTVVWWLAPSPHSERVSSSIPSWDLCSLRVLRLPSKNMHVRLTGDSKMSLGVSVNSFVLVWPCDGL